MTADNEIDAEILSELLDIAKAACDIGENGQLGAEAFEKSTPGQYQLILMDVQMPVMNARVAKSVDTEVLKHTVKAAIKLNGLTNRYF